MQIPPCLKEFTNAIIHNSVPNETVVTEAEQKHLLCLFGLTTSQTGLGAICG